MSCFREENDARLSSVIGLKNEVQKLEINGIHFGDANLNATVELSLDNEVLTIYTEDEFVSVAKMATKNIHIMSFIFCEEYYVFTQ